MEQPESRQPGVPAVASNAAFSAPSLRRALSLPLLVLYELGTTVGAVLGFVFLFPLESLARGTSWTTLSLFALVNWALFRITGRDDEVDPPVQVPRWVPCLGALLCGALLVRDLVASFQ